ncbi:MAG TPA: rhomboid family intramembrane serine protease [Armatimonadota bacterium]|jgi:hypothetical protein
MLPLRDNIPSSRVPVVNYLIILVCVAVYVFQVLNPPWTDQHAFRPSLVHDYAAGTRPAVDLLASALASMFMHGGLLHLLANMWFLWIFGDNVEDRMGPGRYLVFYLICGFAATAAHVAITLAGANLGGAAAVHIPMVGASGAIAGVLAAYMRLFPQARVLTLIPFFFIMVVEIPALLFIGVWFVLQFVSGLSTLGGGAGVAFWAHVGGFLTGLLLVGFFATLRRKPRAPRVLDLRLD